MPPPAKALDGLLFGHAISSSQTRLLASPTFKRPNSFFLPASNAENEGNKARGWGRDPAAREGCFAGVCHRSVGKGRSNTEPSQASVAAIQTPILPAP
jgi:hypothetical protein